jgi:DNA-directed RNA polymerase specialized sigma24 family protein
MEDHDWLAERFEEHRPHLRAVAYRLLGSPSEAEDAVQDAWLRLSRSDTSPALVNGAAGAVWAPGGQPRVVFDFTITRGTIVAIDLLADPARFRQLDLAVLTDVGPVDLDL